MGKKAKARARAEATATVSDPLLLAERLAGLATLVLRRVDRSGGEAGLTEARRSALALLALGGPRTLGSLAAAEGVRPPTMTRMVSAMEAEGLVERTASPSDGRLVILRATPSGEALLARSRAERLAPIATSLDRLGRADRSALGAALAALDRALRDA